MTMARIWHLALALIAAIMCGTLFAQAPRGGNPVDARLLDSLRFRLIGPNAPAGRAWQVVGVPGQPNLFYVCTAQGGVWRSTNFGATIEPIFDEENGASCGAVAISPSDRNVIWVGSGEPAARQSNALGYGAWKSVDAGKTWQHVGLETTEQIAALVIDPRDPNTVYVGAMGHLWGRNIDRGVFRTRDAGRTWQKVLYVDDMTGCIDLAIDPRNPNVLYASTWQRMRSGGAIMRESGPGSGIYKTTDGGDHWTRLTGGLPAEPLSKIELEVAQNAPDTVFAYVLSGEPQRGVRSSTAGGVFRSDDGGTTWQRINPRLASRTYYTHLKIDPGNDKRLWILDLSLFRSDDGGMTWTQHNTTHVHADLHGLWIDPRDSDRLVLAGDGGVHTSVDGGRTWVQTVLPIGQFYELDVDAQDPYWVYGGMQDTASWIGPSRTYDNEGITDHDWFKVRSTGDGMAIHPDPRNPNVIWMAQNSGNTSRLDLGSWIRTEFQPTPAEAKQLGLAPLRWNWTPPLIISVLDPDVIYLGAQYVFRCRVLGPGEFDEVARRCEPVSGDLTRQQDRQFPAVGEGYHTYGSLFSIAQSAIEPNVMWAGSDDGWIHVSRDGTRTWTRVDTNLPSGPHQQGFVSRIEPSRTGAGAAYVAFDLHYHDDTHPYIFKTTDFGKTWTNITSDLPAWGSTYTIREDPHNTRVLYVGTESGLFVSLDQGGHWMRWKSNLPHTGVRSLAIQARDRELVVGTFGRSIWVVDIAPIEQLTDAIAQSAVLFDVKPTTAYNIRYTYGTGVEEVNGNLFFRGENPPYGAVLTYYLKQSVSGNVALTIKDSNGSVVRTLSGPGSPGLHQVQWDLETDAAKAGAVSAGFGDGGGLTPSARQRRRRVAPGTYTATLQIGATTLAKPVVVRKETEGTKRVLPRL